jgi:hypothetical protein
MAFNLQFQQETYSEVISLALLAGSVNGLTHKQNPAVRIWVCQLAPAVTRKRTKGDPDAWASKF